MTIKLFYQSVHVSSMLLGHVLFCVEGTQQDFRSLLKNLERQQMAKKE